MSSQTLQLTQAQLTALRNLFEVVENEDSFALRGYVRKCREAGIDPHNPKTYTLISHIVTSQTDLNEINPLHNISNSSSDSKT